MELTSAGPCLAGIERKFRGRLGAAQADRHQGRRQSLAAPDEKVASAKIDGMMRLLWPTQSDVLPEFHLRRNLAVHTRTVKAWTKTAYLSSPYPPNSRLTRGYNDSSSVGNLRSARHDDSTLWASDLGVSGFPCAGQPRGKPDRREAV